MSDVVSFLNDIQNLAYCDYNLAFLTAYLLEEHVLVWLIDCPFNLDAIFLIL